MLLLGSLPQIIFHTVFYDQERKNDARFGGEIKREREREAEREREKEREREWEREREQMENECERKHIREGSFD